MSGVDDLTETEQNHNPVIRLTFVLVLKTGSREMRKKRSCDDFELNTALSVCAIYRFTMSELKTVINIV